MVTPSKEIFTRVFSASKKSFRKNRQLIISLALVLTILVSIIPTLALYALSMPSGSSDSAGAAAGVLPVISSPVSKLFDVSSIESLWTLIIVIFAINMLFKLIILIISMSAMIYFFYRIVKQDKSFFESVKYFGSRSFTYLGTLIVYLFFLAFLYMLFIIPGIIFSILWMFFAHALFFRHKKFLGALDYSKHLVEGKKMQILSHYFLVQLKLFKYWLPLIAVYIISKFFGLYGQMGYHILSSFVSFIMILFTIIFSVHYFLELERERGIANELQEATSPSSPASQYPKPEVHVSQNEASIRDYINMYKSEYPRDAIRAVLVKSIGHDDAEVDACLDKYF